MYDTKEGQEHRSVIGIVSLGHYNFVCNSRCCV